MTDAPTHYHVVVIGSGFGGTMTALSLARAFKQRGKGETILMLERGTWWTTPVSTVQDKEVKTYDFLLRKSQPAQYWSSQNHFRGFVDLFTRCFRREKNNDGLFEMTRLGTTGFWGLFRRENDGVSVLRANGVGGGSLVYSNITIRPPNLIFNDPRWPLSWSGSERDDYYDLAREAIGHGVLFALDQRDHVSPPASAVNTGLSNISTRSAGLNPHWNRKPDPNNAKRGLKQLNTARTRQTPTSPDLPADDDKKDFQNDLWIDRARVFQNAMYQLNQQHGPVEFGTVDSSINDYDPTNSNNQYDAQGIARNYCERQGRCNVGCLPGARHTLNKQLMQAALGKFNPAAPDDGSKDVPPVFPDLHIQPLAQVDIIEARPQGGYTVHYDEENREDYIAGRVPRRTRRTVMADRVVVAAGCLGTSEIMLRSKDRGTLPNLSSKVGFGFSTNGDYLAFLDKTKEHVSLTRGPVTTSFGHFHTTDTGTGSNGPKFHTLEDQGIPPAMASTIGVGVPLIRSLGNGRHPWLFVFWAILRVVFKRVVLNITAPFKNARQRQDVFRSEDDITARMMCVVAMGRDAAVGQFRLGKGLGDTPLRVTRTDGREFYQDPVYTEIRASLSRLAAVLRDPTDPNSDFQNPFLTEAADALAAKSIALSHPLGGCRMGKDAAEGVVDEYGRVFDTTKTGSRPFYEGLFIADASVIPTALGVNPSLTISALALRIAANIIHELG